MDQRRVECGLLDPGVSPQQPNQRPCNPPPWPGCGGAKSVSQAALSTDIQGSEKQPVDVAQLQISRNARGGR